MTNLTSQAHDEAMLKLALDELDPFVSLDFADDAVLCDSCGEFFEVYMQLGDHGRYVTKDDHVCRRECA